MNAQKSTWKKIILDRENLEIPWHFCLSRSGRPGIVFVNWYMHSILEMAINMFHPFINAGIQFLVVTVRVHSEQELCRSAVSLPLQVTFSYKFREVNTIRVVELWRVRIVFSGVWVVVCTAQFWQSEPANFVAGYNLRPAIQLNRIRELGILLCCSNRFECSNYAISYSSIFGGNSEFTIENRLQKGKKVSKITKSYQENKI